MDWGLDSLGQGLYAKGPGKQDTKRNARMQAEYAREFAQYGIRWRVADAKAAGLHPLAALGASTHTFRPQIVGNAGAQRAAGGLGRAAGSAISAITGAGKPTNDQKAMAELQIHSAVLDNKYKQLRNDAFEMELASPNQGNQLVQEMPSEIVRPSPSNIGVQPGVKSLKDLFVDEHGTVTFELTQEASEPRESASGAKKVKTSAYDTAMLAKIATKPELREKLRQTIIPELRRTGRLKKGETVYWNHILQEFYISKFKNLKKQTRRKSFWTGKPKRIDKKIKMQPFGGGIGY